MTRLGTMKPGHALEQPGGYKTQMARISAGLVMHRVRQGELEVLLVHPGARWGPEGDRGRWSIPKGKVEPGETRIHAACREFAEETGLNGPADHLALWSLGSIRQRSGKVVHAWAAPAPPDVVTGHAVLFDLSRPELRQRLHEAPEIDKAAFFPLSQVRWRINPRQWPLIERLHRKLNGLDHVPPVTF